MRKKCQHDLNISPNSIRLLNKEFLVFPPLKVGICTHCGHSFTYIFEENKYIIKEELEKENG